MLTEPYKPVLLNIPNRILEQLDEAALAMKTSRSELIRKSLARDLEFLLSQEVIFAKKQDQITQTLYRNWTRSKNNERTKRHNHE